MHWSVIHIDRKFKADGYQVWYEDLDGDREDGDATPVVFGSRNFMHYPSEWGRAKALEFFRSYMIEAGHRSLAETATRIKWLEAIPAVKEAL
jgi:hypothetical protein